MSVYRCEVCRAYRRDGERHACPGLRTVDWLRFISALRHWMDTDNRAQFEVYYVRRGASRQQWRQHDDAGPAPISPPRAPLADY